MVSDIFWPLMHNFMIIRRCVCLWKMYCRSSFHPDLFVLEIDCIYGRGIKDLFSCLEMTLSNPRHFNEIENYFPNMVPLFVFDDILLYNIHSSQKWIIFHRILFWTVSGWRVFFLLPMKASNCKRVIPLTPLWINYFFCTVVFGY